MAKVAIINNETEHDGLQYIGDIVDIYEDDRYMSPTMLEMYNFITIKGSVSDVRNRLDQIKPRIEEAYQLPDESWGFNVPDGVQEIAHCQVYQVEGSNRWYVVNNSFKFPFNIAGLTPEEKQLLETVDINHPSVDSFVRKIAKDIAVLSGNDTEIKALRNQEP